MKLFACTLFAALTSFASPAGAAPRIDHAYGRLPLHFEANLGQTDRQVQFLSRGSGYNLYLTASEAVLVLSKSGHLSGHEPPQPGVTSEHRPQETTSVALRMALVGANPAPLVSGLEELPGKTNYFIGKDPARWRTNVPTYAKVRYQNVYPGIDLVYYGNQRQLEYDFVVAPGADPRRIVLRFEGANSIEIDASGDLLLHAAGGSVRQRKPILYQHIGGTRTQIAGRYVLRGADRVAFEVAAYDRNQSLTIDPVLTYSTYLGGEGIDYGSGIAVDGEGNAYVTGLAWSVAFPTTTGVVQSAFGGSGDAFVTKFNPAGSALVYSTYLGGSGHEHGEKIALDATGSAYVTGHTRSSDFPVTPNGFQTRFGGLDDAFVAKLDPQGSALAYCTYLGGSGIDFGLAIVVSADGKAYVTGYTESPNYPTTPSIFQVAHRGGFDAFVTSLNSAGSALAYSTYLGGGGLDYGRGIALDSDANAYIAGSTDSADFPVTAEAFQRAFAGGFDDPFVTKLDPMGSTSIYSTYLGGTSNDRASGIALGEDGSAYVVGTTWSRDYPTTPGAFQPVYGGGPYDAYVVKLNPRGSGIVYATYMGGDALDYGQGIAVDSHGAVYVTGNTYSLDFPTKKGAFQERFGGNSDAFVAQLDPGGSRLISSSYLGGSDEDWGAGIALGGVSPVHAYVSGYTASSDFPTRSALQAVYGGGERDAFVAKVTDTAPLPPYAGMPFPRAASVIPGSFEAEDFDVGSEGVAYHDNVPGNAGGQYRPNEDVDIIVSTDSAGGSYVVNNFETGEWLAYTIDVEASANYDIELRVATNLDFPNATVHIEIDDVNVTGPVILSDTGGWNSFQWLSKKGVPLSAGQHVLKIVADRQYFNLNSIRVTAAPEPTSVPFSGTPVSLPGTFEAEDFNLGGEGLAYHDNIPGNAGGQYRPDEDVDIIVSSDSVGGGFVVNNFESREWLAYTVDVATSGTYDIELRVATSPDFPGSTFHIEIDGRDVTGPVVLPDTGGWSSFQWLGKKGIALAAGPHMLRIVTDRQYFNLNSVRVLPSTPVRSEESAATYGGSWTTYGPETGTFSGGTVSASDNAGASATFGFTGTTVSWVGVRCNVCGIANVSIDQGAPIPVDTAGSAAPGDPGLVSEPVFMATGLAAGAPHTLTITVTGGTTSGGAHIAVDAFDVVP